MNAVACYSNFVIRPSSAHLSWLLHQHRMYVKYVNSILVCCHNPRDGDPAVSRGLCALRGRARRGAGVSLVSRFLVFYTQHPNLNFLINNVHGHTQDHTLTKALNTTPLARHAT